MYVSDSSSAVLMQHCVIQKSLSDGLDIDMQSMLGVEDSSIENNSAAGIFISNQSVLLLGTYPTQRIRITGNGFGGVGNGRDGLHIDGSNVQLNFGVLTVSGNQGTGIHMEGGRLQFYGGEADSPGVIPGSVVNVARFLQKWPRIQHFPQNVCISRSIFQNRSFSSPGILIY